MRNSPACQCCRGYRCGADKASREEFTMIATVLIVVLALAIATIGRAALDPQH